MTPARASLALAVVVCAWSACTRADPPITFDQARLVAESDRRFEAALSKPESEQAMTALFERIGEDAQVAAAGERLLAAVVAEPRLGAAVEMLSGRVGEMPAMDRLAADLMASHPGLAPEQLGELAGVKVGEAITPALDQAMDAMLERPDLARLFEDFGRRFARNRHVVAAIGAAMTKPGRTERWSKRLRALAGGKSPDRQRATDLILEHAFTVERCARFFISVLSTPELTARLTEATRAMLAAPSFRRHVSRLLETVVTDPVFQREALAVMEALLEHAVDGGKEDRTAVDARLQALLMRPEVTRALAEFVAAVLTDPELAAIGDEAVAAVMKDPGFQASLDLLLDDW